MDASDLRERAVPEPGREFYTPRELATKLRVSPLTIKKWTVAHRVPGQLKCGGRWRYRRLDVEKAELRGVFLNGV